MRFGEGLAFVIDESWAFVRVGWWLPLLAGVPYLLSEMVRWGETAPSLAPHYAASLVTAVLDLYVFLVIVRFVAGGRRLGSALRIDAGTLRLFAPYAGFSLIFAAAQYYLYLTDESALTYWLSTAAGVVIGALLAPWAVAAALGIAECGPRRSIHMAAPHIAWSVALYGLVIALENAGYFVIAFLPMPIPDVALGGLTFAYVGFGLMSLAFGSLLVILNQVATIAIARRAGLTLSIEEDALRETFS